jgi:glycosyltransferase involved in cell wall biosynthesis
LGFVGRIAVEKGVLDLVEALKLLGPKAPYLAVWGSGPLEREFTKRMAGVRGRFLGALPFDKAQAAFHACDIVAAPSHSTATWVEQFGRTALEAMACGRPVVAYDSGELPTVIGSGGALVRERSVRDLAAAIDKLTQDGDLRLKAAQNALERSRAYRPELLSRRLARMWEEVSRL